jgi:hypothetical protein
MAAIDSLKNLAFKEAGETDKIILLVNLVNDLVLL